MKNLKQPIISIVVCLVILAGVNMISAWTGPTQSPPNGNVAAPINISSASQYKSGALGVGGIFEAYSDAIIDGNITAESNTYGTCTWRTVTQNAMQWTCNNGEFVAGIGYESAEWTNQTDNHISPEVNRLYCCKL